MSSPPANSPARTASDRSVMKNLLTASTVLPAYPFVKLMVRERIGGHGGASGKCYDDHGKGNGNREKFQFERVRALMTPHHFKAAYGGHVYAQSAYATTKTVGKGTSHTRSLPGFDDTPFIFTVRHVREGLTYCLRAVDVSQGEGVYFSCLCSFKQAEQEHNFQYQQPGDMQQRYEDRGPSTCTWLGQAIMEC
ncbi:hypothetical protein PAAG_11579 [Paracoccidioides lutzii Pb01]|uniref:Acyl-CoA thioesterase-like N-terminal HotDog domain-containing protein n=1 Tax=Paracoccidioides lutzii (strain ATCC MYA-826 / Pb01) TaxID=502779 RepID=A0A0A2V5X8_PARBA|nr:hypothetical protein PAAG_11579 [Paracoccidioides lutzii Pb01]KGQ01727.1 hypothetical protein PAAG_11579 [Paracoccidioides lutzii Pb01]